MKPTDYLNSQKEFNLWRRGKIEDNPNTPKEIGEALEVVIALVENKMKKPAIVV